MAYSRNLAMLTGRVGRAPETRHTQSGATVCNFSLATTEQWKDKITGEKKEKTEWHRCMAWGKPGEIIGQYVNKGDMLDVTGTIETRKWQGQDGQDRYTTEIRVRDFILFPRGSGQGSGQSSSQGSGQESGPQPAQDFDDDIPF